VLEEPTLPVECSSLAQGAVPKASGGHGMRHLAELQGAVRATEQWIDDLQQRLGWHDRDRVYSALLATLHALRDVLAQKEAVYVGAQLPDLLRGLYYDGWHPSGRTPPRSRSAFIERIQDGVRRDPGIDAEQVAPPFLRCSRRACLLGNSKTPRLPHRNRCAISGRTDLGNHGRLRRPESIFACGSGNPDLSVWASDAGSQKSIRRCGILAVLSSRRPLPA
jgi:uncharacterized protein (DUF2267 family)